jgi:phosphomannomutase
MASSIVSSMMLEHIAKDAGLEYARTLTGFKWVSRVPNLIYGYEEALGYCVNPDFVGDKDGVSAVTFFLELVAALKEEKRSCWDVLNEIALQHGLHSSDQVSVKVRDLSQVPTIMNSLRTNPPKELGGLQVQQVHDLAEGYEGLPATDGVILMLSGNQTINRARVIVRPSGTEPKIKCYLEVVVSNNDLNHAQEAAKQSLDLLATDAKPLLS